MMKYLIPLLCIPLMMSLKTSNFRKEQLKYQKVRTAYDQKWGAMKKLVYDKGLDTNTFTIFIRGFKKEKKLEVWGISSGKTKYILLKTFDFCVLSGKLGPKRQEGDGQVPEGFYMIDTYNPESNYYVSLGISYPNRSDEILGKKGNLGGAIFIHGNCVSIGCIPITDDCIKELYILAIESKMHGQTVHAHIFPTKLDEEGLKSLNEQYSSSPNLISFWKNLKPGYDYFEKNKKLPAISINNAGKYVWN